jgi:plastocyanin
MKAMLRKVCALPAALAVVALGSCADFTPAQAQPVMAAVRLTDSFTFEPKMVTIHAGEAIEWRNDSPFVHTKGIGMLGEITVRPAR